MKLSFDSENTTNCPVNGISTRQECYACIYFKMRFVDTLRGKKAELICWGKELHPEPSDKDLVGVK